MIIVKLMGGLGNQIFQYALGRSLALKHGVELRLDISPLKGTLISGPYTTRDFALDAFNIKAGIASEKDLAGYKRSKVGKMADRVLLQMGLNELYVKEIYFQFDPKVLKAPKDCYLDGYWQSEKYFEETRKELQEDLLLKEPLEGKNKELAARMSSEDSVSIHVRKGDYLSIPANQALFQTLDSSYYLEALEKICKDVPSPRLYVFSDDPYWFRSEVKTDLPVEYIYGNSGKNSYLDMQLMSLCKHNIIANSSFSWWGAWLNRNGDKKVIAPEKWFRNNVKDSSDLVPKSWIRI